MDKRYYKDSRFYKVYHQPTAREYYFQWKPTVGDLKLLSYFEDLSNFEDFHKNEFYIDTIDFQDSFSYKVKLRHK